MRPPIDTITPPPFPARLPWVNVASLRMDQQRGRPVLVEFWDFARVQSLRTLPYLKAWHERYADAGLRVVGVHSPGFPISRGEEVVRAAVERLGIAYPVLIDDDLRLWTAYDNEGWPARYLWAPRDEGHVLYEFHYGEGGYQETERAIQELLGIEREPVAPVRPEDDPEARVVIPTPEQRGAWSGPYEAGAVWAVLSGRGVVRANGTEIVVDHPGAYLLVEHPHHTQGVLELEVGDGVECHAVSFTPGLAPE
jgi:mannose-6-phosphate isomerase-like protein (cupin superfamily)